MTIKTILFLFTAIVISGCKPNDDYNINYDGDKLVVNAVIETTTGVTVALSKSQSPIGLISDEGFEVKNGRVWLYQNDTLVAEMTVKTDGRFTINNFKPQAGKSYRLKAVGQKLDTVESLSVVMPDAPTITSYSLKQDTIPNINVGRGNILFSFNLKDNSDQKNYYYIDSYVQINKDSVGRYFSRGLRNNYADCEFGRLGNYVFFTDKCFNGTDFKIDYGSEHNKKGTIVIEVCCINKDFFTYLDEFDQPEGLRLGFAEPKLAVSNIKNGYGIFYAKNISSFSLKLD
jgi:hypothetical protein